MVGPRIVIAGSGSIGCFVGGCLADAGHDVAFLGRATVLDGIRDQGLRLTDFTGLAVAVHPATLSDDPAILGEADLILVTVKSGATSEMAELIATHAQGSATIVSLQNGMENAAMLKDRLPDSDVRAGMVPFNVVPKGPGAYHRATSGEIAIAAGPGEWAALLSTAALPITETDRIEAVQWAKLLLNLTNAINALSGLPLPEMLRARPWRLLMADQMAEALRVLKAAGIPVQSSAPVPMSWVPRILRLPTPLYTRVAAGMLTIDPEARTSMAYDLMAGRLTEVDQLQGRILELARNRRIATPVIAAVHRAVKSAEAGGTTPLNPAQIRAA
ncbi:2-dehydropantoate 2-reductase [Aestuariivita sp.]|jgi:2-dehydropantoate 2-reductase|uniref:2-dehydropantoate 2-reductase n=1 Tax=Aestuariivita sp. TaxID=1872407 RepID=UPI00217425C0|nr:2-dehydropantoate 2-reductase [Aestuariivita sp.]MCE8008008.1 2-dehydropantoate 2-reductase [Aestuariivita sp.]